VPVPAGMPDAALTRGRRMNIVYLHGFASSAASTKAAFFASQFARHGIAVRAPDLNEPDFRTLTMTRMVEQVTALVGATGSGPVTLIGSSLGAAVAILAASALPDRVDRLVLLAPAVMLARPGHHLLPPDRIDEWRRNGVSRFFHYAYGEERPLDFGFYDDSLRHDLFDLQHARPALIFQGSRDAVVAAADVTRYAEAAPNRRLVLLDDDHQLTGSLPRIWRDTEAFLGLSPAPAATR
jgi:uncharacterized protein